MITKTTNYDKFNKVKLSKTAKFSVLQPKTRFQFQKVGCKRRDFYKNTNLYGI